MAEITAALVKELRENTGAGMMDCKKALTENDGDLDASVDWLRKEGLAAAAKKAGRVAAEGLVGLATSDNHGAVVEVNAETDFVARNETFQEFVSTVATLALDGGESIENVAAKKYPGGDGTVAEQATNLIATIGENMEFRRCAAIEVESGCVASYMHNALTPNLGRIGVLVGLNSSGDAGRLAEFGKQLAMHIAATNPVALGRDAVAPELLERERNVLVEQARASGRPDDIIEKMVDGRMRKFYEENCLLEQTFVIDNETKVSVAVENFAKELGSPVEVTGYVRFALGEGVEKEEEDFAAEVAATLNA